MSDRAPFEYVVIRVMPRVDRQEFINVGVIIICRPHRFLGAEIAFDENRIRGLAPSLDDSTIEDIGRQLEGMRRIAAGDPTAGPLAKLDMGERWHWLVAPSSTMIQPSPVHTGLCRDPKAQLGDLFFDLVSVQTEPVRGS